MLLSAQGGQFLLQTSATVALARILTPADFGLVSMVAVAMALASAFRDSVLTVPTIQRTLLTRQEASSLFWLNALLNTALGLLVVLSGPILARFFGRPEVVGIAGGFAIAFVLSGVASQHQALLRRRMRFGALAALQVIPQIGNVAVSILLALCGAGFWALVAGALAAALLTPPLAVFFCRWIPSRPGPIGGIRDAMAFGASLVGFNIVNYLARNLDRILIGRIHGPDLLGLYIRAYAIFMLPMSQVRDPITQVALPALSALRCEPLRFRNYYAHLVHALACIVLPLSFYSILEAEFIVGLVLGPQWAGAVPVYRWLAVAGLVQPTVSTAGLVLLSSGLASRNLALGALNSGVVMLSFIVGLPYGITGVAMAYAAASWTMALPTALIAFRGTPVLVREFLAAHRVPLLTAAASVSAAVAARAAWRGNESLGSWVSLVAWAAVFVALTISRRTVREAVAEIFQRSRVQL